MSADRASFPQNVDEFEEDPRISWSKLDGKWILEESNGTEWEFNEAVQKWVLPYDEDEAEKQRQAYAVEGVDEEEPAQPNKKRKVDNGDDQSAGDVKKGKKKSKTKVKETPRNTAVYVTSLPLDVTAKEVEKEFSRYGVIAEEIDSGKPRIKLYTDENGNFKGDALVVYFRPESIRIAVQMLDETDFRLGEPGPNGKMRVTEADRSYKKRQEAPGEGQEKDEKKKAGRSKDQEKIIKRTQKLNEKLADWSSDEDISTLPDTSSRFDKVVILKYMFTLKELEEDPAALLDIKEDIREECGKLGEVTNVQLFDKEADGVVSVRFGTSESARACVRMMNGRMFSGQAVEATIATGDEKFKKTRVTKSKMVNDDASESEEEERMNKFGEYLEGRGSGTPTR